MKEAPDQRSGASFGESKLGERLIDLSKRYVCSILFIPGNLNDKHKKQDETYLKLNLTALAKA